MERLLEGKDNFWPGVDADMILGGSKMDDVAPLLECGHRPGDTFFRIGNSFPDACPNLPQKGLNFGTLR